MSNPQGPRNDEGSNRRRRNRGRGKNGEPSLETVLADAAGLPRPPKPQHPHQQKKHHNNNQNGQWGGKPHHNHQNRNHNNHNNHNARRVRPPGREHEEFPRREHENAGYKRNAETWWADRWLAVLHRFGWKGRLANGRMYADEGRVTNFAVEAGRIRASVQGSRTQPYDVQIAIRPLPDNDWELVTDILSCQALFTAQLLAGDMPQDIEEVFDAAYAPLFPRTPDDIKAHCSCPDRVVPCKHIAAVYYVMADAFDKDPFLIFQLRGRTRDQLIGMVRAARAADAAASPMAVETLDAGSLEPFRFWQAGEELTGVQVQIGEPPFPGATAKRLGRPPFWRSPADPITRLADVYESIARRAREVALVDAAPGARR